MSKKDDIYTQPRDHLTPFRFDQQVVDVFEDMIQRSVPGYKELVEQIGILASHVVTPDSYVYDLGTSLGATTLAIRRHISDQSVKVIAVDNSSAMIERCRGMIDAYHSKIPVQLIEDDIMNIDIQNASLVVLNFTLQFIPKQNRDALISRIYAGLLPGGVLVLSEKLANNTAKTEQLLRILHEDFKRYQGYSELEISQKRDALQNVLIPETSTEHILRFEKAGFNDHTLWHRQYNFASFLAIK